MQISVTALSTVPMAYDRVKQKVGAMRQDCAVRQVDRGAQRDDWGLRRASRQLDVPGTTQTQAPADPQVATSRAARPSVSAFATGQDK